MANQYGYENKIILKEKKQTGSESQEQRTSDLQRQSTVPRPTETFTPTEPGSNDPEDLSDYEAKRQVIFYASPEVSEQSTALYTEFSEIRAPASVSVWMGSPSRTFSINAKLVSRTESEATKTWRYMNILRSWRMPNKTKGTTGVGLPDTAIPSVLNLFGYGKTFRAIPVVITALNIEWSSEYDYIKDDNKNDVPIILPITLNLREMRTVKDMDTFNIEEYRAGKLNYW